MVITDETHKKRLAIDYSETIRQLSPIQPSLKLGTTSSVHSPQSFSVTNGVSCFQRKMVKFVEENDLEAAFPYFDNITIRGKDQKENGVNMEHFLEDSKRKNIC